LLDTASKTCGVVVRLAAAVTDPIGQRPGQVEVAAFDPVASMQAVENPDLEEVACQIREKLRKVVEGFLI